MVFPVTLGGGQAPQELSDARTVGAGIQLLTYERTASFRRSAA